MPRTRPSPALRRRALPKTAKEASALVEREALVLLGFERRAARENLVVRWSQKRRDRVDQILVRELHAEEASWRDYTTDEAAVKDQVADAIADMLVEDLAKELKELNAAAEVHG